MQDQKMKNAMYNQQYDSVNEPSTRDKKTHLYFHYCIMPIQGSQQVKQRGKTCKKIISDDVNVKMRLENKITGGSPDTQQNGIRHNGTQQNDIRHNDTHHNEIRQCDTQHNDIQHK